MDFNRKQTDTEGRETPKELTSMHHRRITWSYKWVVGSAFSASLVEFLIFYAITLASLPLIYFAIEPHYPLLFPISGTALAVIFFAITFAGTAFLGYEFNLHTGLVARFKLYSGGIVQLAHNCITGSSDWSVPVSSNTNTKIRNMTTRELLLEVNKILRVAAIANRHELESSLTAPDSNLSQSQKRRIQRQMDLDYSDFPSNLIVERLPLDKELQKELNMYKKSDDDTSGLSDMLFTMAMYRMRDILAAEENPGYGSVFDGLQRQVSLITTDSADMAANKAVGTVPIIIGYLRVLMWIWCLAQPFLLWGEYYWATILVLPLTIWPFLALVEAAQKLADPFVSFTESPYIWNNISKDALGTMQLIDKMFDVKFDRMRSGPTSSITQQ